MKYKMYNTDLMCTRAINNIFQREREREKRERGGERERVLIHFHTSINH